MEQACHYQRFDTGVVPPADRFDFWRTWYDQAVDVRMRLAPVGPTGTNQDRFAASAHVLTAAGLEIVEITCGPADGTWTRHATEVKDLLRLVVLAPTVGGTASWHTRHLRLDHGTFAVLGRTAGRWHAPAGMHGIQVNLPRTLLDLPDPRIDELIERGAFPPALIGLVGPALAGMAGHLPALAGIQSSELSNTWAAMARMLLHAMAGQDLDSTDLSAARRTAIDQCIQAHLAEPDLGPDRIAAMLRISRRSLYAAFAAQDHRSPGYGISARIRHHRLETARTMLADPDSRQPVHVIAAMVGIPDPAHFSRLFHTAYGLSPRNYQLSTR